MSGNKSILMSMYQAMLGALGPSSWWPGDTPFEVAVGAVLTQNTAWGNVEKAVARLKERGALTPGAMWNMPLEDLEECLRPSGYFRIKAQRLRNLLAFFSRAADGILQPPHASPCAPPDDPSLSFLCLLGTPELRKGLLSVKGIGPETADSILLYALGRERFVVDAYTHRMFSRHGLIGEEADYHEMADFFMDSLDADVSVYNEYHALIVRVGKDFCKKSKPLCAQCPLKSFLEYEP